MKNSVKIFLVVILVALLGVNYFVLTGDFGDKQSEVKSEVLASIDGEAGEDSGEVSLGDGYFELVDQNGKKFTSEDLKGKISIIYFGFTNCIMICPTAVSATTLAINELDKKLQKDIQPILITVDPERDTQERLKEWLSNFHENYVGLTGSEKQLKNTYDVFKVFAASAAEVKQQKAESEKAKDEKEKNYQVSHTSIIYIMDKSGNFVSHFTHESKPDEIKAKLLEVLESEK